MQPKSFDENANLEILCTQNKPATWLACQASMEATALTGRNSTMTLPIQLQDGEEVIKIINVTRPACGAGWRWTRP